MSDLPKRFYVDKTPENVTLLEDLGFVIQGEINYTEDNPYAVLYVNNTKSKSGIIRPKRFIETNKCRGDKYQKVDSLPKNKYIDLYFIEMKSNAEFEGYVWADSPLEALNKYSKKSGLNDFSLVTCRRICNKSEIIN